MRLAFRARWQAALVILLFLGSLAALAVSSAMAFFLPSEELRVREQVGAAAARLARDGAPALEESWPAGPGAPPGLLQRLRTLAETDLSKASATEGGYYLGGDLNQFTDGGPPGGPRPPPPGDHRPPPPPWEDHGPPPGRDRPPPPDHEGPRPPPRESPYIRQQARDCLSRPPEQGPLVQTLDIGPGRVVVGTAPVGDQRPARAAAWAMVRLDGPEQQQARLVRTQIAAGFAIAGILLALVLTANLAWTVRRERGRREKAFGRPAAVGTPRLPRPTAGRRGP